MPQVTLVADSVRLRPFELADAPEVRDGVDAEVLSWVPLPDPYGLPEAEEFCGELAERARRSGDGQHWAVTQADGGRFLATVGLNRTRWEHGVTEIGYWAAPWARRQGRMSEAVRAVSVWALRELGMARVELLAVPRNAGSLGVARSAGFSIEGVLRCAHRHRGEQHDLVVHSLVRADLE